MTQLQTDRGPVKVPAGTWKPDTVHSSVAFEVKHVMIATVRGIFSTFGGELLSEDDPERSRASGWVSADSIDTGNADRDAHLRSPDFLDAERYPTILFTTTGVRHVEGGLYRVTGELTIKDIARVIEVDADVQGLATDPWGHRRAGIAVRGTINRTEFGLTWQTLMEGGGMLVGEKVKILVDISAVPV